MRDDITTLDEIRQIINEKDGVLLYFSASGCGVCKALKPKVEKEFGEKFSKIEQLFINATNHPKIAASFSVFSMPTILVFLDSKEFARESRNVSLELLLKKIKRPYEIMTNKH